MLSCHHPHSVSCGDSEIAAKSHGMFSVATAATGLAGKVVANAAITYVREAMSANRLPVLYAHANTYKMYWTAMNI